MELCKSDEVSKEATVNELRRQVNELIAARTMEMNLFINEPGDCGVSL